MCKCPTTGSFFPSQENKPLKTITASFIKENFFACKAG
jgi:hypothetical protein